MSAPITISKEMIIDEQNDFIVVHKPAGINFHDEDDLGQGFFNLVKQQLNLDDLYPVHRLDKLTSGLIIFAKTLSSARWFQESFAQHSIEKYYLALTDKKPKKKQGLIKGDMVKARRGVWKLLRTNNNPAITQFFSYGLSNKTRLFILKPHTGKTHQIRVALNSLGAPIIGDNYYHRVSNSDRGYLHAYALKFNYQQQTFEYLAPPNSGELFLHTECIEQLAKIGKPWQLLWPQI